MDGWAGEWTVDGDGRLGWVRGCVELVVAGWVRSRVGREVGGIGWDGCVQKVLNACCATDFVWVAFSLAPTTSYAINRGHIQQTISAGNVCFLSLSFCPLLP